jgi:hypothetical protein
MKRVGIVVGTLVAGIVVLAMVGFSGGSGPWARPDSPGEGSSAAVAREMASPCGKRRREARWTCAVRHARTGYEYKCTERGEEKSCRCAIQKCKHWNQGQERHCSRNCRCTKG